MIPGVDSDWIKDQIDAVRDEIGRFITLRYPQTSACSICVASGYLDTISNTSWYTLCPECSGNYWVGSIEEREVLARVHWVSNEAITATPGGKHYLGDAHITVDPSEREFLVRAQADGGSVVVDEQEFSIHKINPMGTPTINRIRAILIGEGSRLLQ